MNNHAYDILPESHKKMIDEVLKKRHEKDENRKARKGKNNTSNRRDTDSYKFLFEQDKGVRAGAVQTKIKINLAQTELF